MIPTDDLEKRIKEIRVTTTDAVDQRILEDASAALENPPSTRLNDHPLSAWRTVMSNKWAKLAAAVLILATLATITFNRQLVPVAYALEQTIQANLGLRSIHIRSEPPGEGCSEAWAQFGDDGRLLRLRMNFPNTPDGEKDVVWQQGKAEVWFKTKGHVLVAHEKEIADKISRELAAFDPKLAIERLHEAEADGKVKIQTQESSAEGDPITLVATSNDSPDKREIYRINPQTKLVEQMERYERDGNEWKLVLRHEFLDYNQEIPPETFVLDTPDDVYRIDWTTQQVGLSKGELTDKEIAVKVAREFFEALIAKDYGRAGQILSGMPASKMEEMFGRIEFLRIDSIGDATPHPDARMQALHVPCEVEIRVEGETRVQRFAPIMRAIENQPDRWIIVGGI